MSCSHTLCSFLVACMVLNFELYNTVKPAYKGHSRKPGNVTFMSNYSLYTGYSYMFMHY